MVLPAITSIPGAISLCLLLAGYPASMLHIILACVRAYP